MGVRLGCLRLSRAFPFRRRALPSPTTNRGQALSAFSLYLSEMRHIRSSGSAKDEVSYYGALEQAFNAVIVVHFRADNHNKR